MRFPKLILAIAAMLCLAACGDKNQSKTPIYAWEGINKDTNMEELSEKFRFWKSNGLVGVCMGCDDPEVVKEASKRAHAEGLEYHAWIGAMTRGGKPHGWYTVNRLGQPSDEFPPYVSYYTTLDPADPEVREYLCDLYASIAEIPEVDYVQLDYIRYADVILSRGLWDKYGLVMNEEYAPADYCYCDDCVAAFKEKTGIDIKEVEDPSKVKEWAQFRCDQVTELVNMIVDAVHAKGKKVSADVFPGPMSHAYKMVRQEWSKWNVDMLFPMNYNDFYMEGADWLATICKEETESAPAGIPVMSGLFICPDWRNKDKVTDPENSGLLPSEMETAVRGSLDNGAAGICLFTPGRMSPEHWEALAKAVK